MDGRAGGTLPGTFTRRLRQKKEREARPLVCMSRRRTRAPP